jgi:hypothetical protein
MTALAQDRTTKSKWTGRYIDPIGMAASTVIFGGGLVAVNTAGNTRPAANVDGLRVIGVSQEKADNSTGIAGAQKCGALTGVFLFKNSGTRALVAADVGRICYVEDDQTVQDEGNGPKVIAGIVESVTAAGVYVFVAPEIGGSGASDLAGIETVSTATALSLFTRTSLVSPTGTMAMTIGSGRFVGQRKTIRMIGGASTPIANIAGAFTTDTVATTSAQFNAAADQLEIEWNGTAWQVLANVSVTLS